MSGEAQNEAEFFASVIAGKYPDCKLAMDFEEFKTVFDDFIVNIFNRKGSAGKNHKGLCPDELFYSEYKQRIAPSADALKLFCMRTSKTYTISRNGIIDRQLDITYWADWLVSKTKVFDI